MTLADVRGGIQAKKQLLVIKQRLMHYKNAERGKETPPWRCVEVKGPDILSVKHWDEAGLVLVKLGPTEKQVSGSKEIA